MEITPINASKLSASPNIESQAKTILELDQKMKIVQGASTAVKKSGY